MTDKFTQVTRRATVFVAMGLAIAPVGARLSQAAATPAGDAGKTTFEDNCAVCHDEDGSGSTAIGMTLMVPDLRSAEAQKHTDKELIDIVTNGMDPMPSFKDKLSADEIKGVVAYIRTLAKNKQ